VGVGVAGHALGPGQSKVGQLQFAAVADEQVLRLDIPMEDTPLVAVGESTEQLEEEQAHVAMVQAARMLLHVLRQIRILQLGDISRGCIILNGKRSKGV